MSQPAEDTLATITFLCTDIAGSTQHWQQDRVLMRQRLEQHDDLTRALIGQNGGDLFKMRGDGAFAAFPSAPLACAAATALQQALHSKFGTDFQVRSVLHSGEAQHRDGDYAGLAIGRAARMLEIAHGGQILLSEATARLLLEAEPRAHQHLLDLGEHQLRSLEQRDRLFQLNAEGLPTTFPPLASATLPPHNLPRTLTTFIGREREVADVERLLETTRLLTILGVGGNGKTRLALQVADNLLPHYPGGVWFVDLAPVVDPSLLPRALAAALRVREETGSDVLTAVQAHLTARKTLVVLDNCEHLVEACTTTAEQLLTHCPELRLLATSREALELFGEIAWPLPGLSVPPEDIVLPQRLLRYEAVRLFVERATAVVPTFRLTPSNGPIIAQICRRLDGIPLALEIAAAALSALSVEQIATRITRIPGRPRPGHPRQRTLKDTLLWSEKLLSEPEKVLWRRLSVFAGSFSLEAAEAICADSLLPLEGILDSLFGLVRKSLLLHDGDRYRLLETIREYGSDRLTEANETSAFQLRHLEFYTTLAEEAEPHLRGPDQKEWLDRLDIEYGNITIALLRASDGTLALRLANALFWFWWIRGHVLEARQHLGNLLARFPEIDPLQRALSLRNRGIFSSSYMEAQKDLDEALQIYLDHQEFSNAAIIQANLGIQASDAGHFEDAQKYLEQAAAYYTSHPDPRRQAQILLNIGTLQMRTNQFTEAKQSYQKSLSLYAHVQDPFSEANIICNLGYLAQAQHKYNEAYTHYYESLARRVQLNDRSTLAKTLLALTLVLHNTNLSNVFLAQLLGKIEQLQAEGSDPLDEKESSDYTNLLTELRKLMNSSELEHWKSEGSFLSLDAVLEEINCYAKEKFPNVPQI